MLKYSDDDFIGDKIKFKEIKDHFKIEKFTANINSTPSSQIINKKEIKLIDIFKVLEKITNVEISFYDEFTVAKSNGLPGFFKKISPDLLYEPVVTFRHDEKLFKEHQEYGLLKCTLDNKKNFQYYLISNCWYMNDYFPQGDVVCRNFYNLNQNIDADDLLDNLIGILNLNRGKIAAQNVTFYKNLNWSNETIKSYIKNSNIRFYNK